MSGVLPGTPNAFDKWYSGKTKPRSGVWQLFKILSSSPDMQTKCRNTLKSEFDVENISVVANRLGIPGDTIDLNRFASAVLNQLIDFSDNKGDCDNNCPLYYQGGVINTEFGDYFDWATRRYGVLKLLGGTEVPFKDYYVCNILGERRYKYGDRVRRIGSYVENATLSKIRWLNGSENRKTVIVACGGSGKSLMLQRLLLEAKEAYDVEKIMPLFIELRYFKESEDLEEYIYNVIHNKDESFTKGIYNQLLMNGKCAILLDGLDEVDPQDIDGFHKKLNDFTEKYKKVQFIVASRDCDSIKGLNDYKHLHVWPFDDEQTEELIERILGSDEPLAVKTRIQIFITNGFLKRRGVFSTHPMLLTFIIRNHDKLDEFYDNHLLFYQLAYEALLSDHDDNKKPYTRIFHSVKDADDFTLVFKEFCGITYADGIREFDVASFNKYYNKLKNINLLRDKSKMSKTNFLHDCCSTSCILYEERPGIFYLDPGFQEFLFAEYYADAESTEIMGLYEKIWDKSLIDFDNKTDAFEMLYSYSETKVNTLIVLPYLNSIFKGKTLEERFLRFLVNSFDEIQFSCVTDKVISSEPVYIDNLTTTNINEPSSIIIAFILNVYDFWSDFIYETHIEAANYEDKDASLVVIEHQLGSTFTTVRNYRPQSHIYKQLTSSDSYIYDNQEFIKFGYMHRLNTQEIYDNPDKFSGLIKAMITDKSCFYVCFKELETIYEKLKKNQKRSRFK